MQKKIIPQTEPFLGKEELKEVSDCIKAKWISGGPKLKKFQEKIAKICGVKHAIGVCNGTQALYVGLKILGIGSGDEVIVPDFTFIASANAVIWAGGTPVFVDIDAKTFNINPEKIEEVITPKTKAIMPVHIYGQSADMGRIMEIAKKHNLFVIEDAAQGIMVSFQGKPVGGFGDVGCMSFYADKVLTTGEGGMVLTNNDELFKKATILLNQGRTGRGWYIHDYMGYNFRLTDLQAAVGLAQIKKLPDIISKRNKIEKLYQKYLAGVKGIKFPYVDPRGKRVPWRMIILVEKPKELSEFLDKEGIKTVRTFYPLHLQPCYNIAGDFPNSFFAYEKILRLPSATALTEREVRYVCDKIKLFFKKTGKK
ncbi:MAG: DegT/DnrJ/EryC1/StrS family aminotransferase [Candidatus Nealsonbacteria bacterium]|nr:DegT/DnrJ/EryC1/StrS family aminotransferase [Candidatus Nealsonbacteria bacterium]